MPKVPAPTVAELALLAKSLSYNVDDSHFKRITNSVAMFPTVHMFLRVEGAGLAAWGKSNGEIDASPELVLACNWQWCSYRRMQIHRENNGDLVRRTNATDTCREQLYEVEIYLAPSIANRYTRMRSVWYELDQSKPSHAAYAVAFESPPPAPEGGPRPFTKKAVMASTVGILLIDGVTPRTSNLTMLQKVDMGGQIPSWLVNSMSVYLLKMVLDLQAIFRRVDRVVDKEVREATASEIRASDCGVQSDEQAMFDKCSSLMDDFERPSYQHFVKNLPPTSPFVEYTMLPAQKRTSYEKGSGKQEEDKTHLSGRRVGTGKAVSVIDTSVEEATAWLFDICSRERMRLNMEDNAKLPRIIARSNKGVNVKVMAGLKLMPFGFQLREFLVHMAWFKLGHEKIAAIVQSIDDNFDYGMGMATRTVRGSTTAFQVLEATGTNSCSIVLYQKVDLGGNIPVGLVNSKIATTLNTVNNLRLAFKRDEEIDAESRKALVAEIRGLSTTTHNATNLLVVQNSTLVNDEEEEKATFDFVADSVRPDIRWPTQKKMVEGGPDCFVKTFRISQHGHGVFAAELVVDAEMHDCVAWQVLRGSRRRTESYFVHDGGSHRNEKRISKCRWEVYDKVVGDRRRQGHHDEMIAKSELLWKTSDDGAGYIVVERVKESQQYFGRRLSLLTTDEKLFEALPKAVVEEWKADEATDQAIFETIKERIRNHQSAGGAFTADENACFDIGVQMENQVASSGAEIKAIKTQFTLLEAKVASVGHAVYGHVTCWIRANALDVLAFYWGDLEYQFTMKHERSPSTKELRTLEVVNEHHLVVYGRYTSPFSDREFVGKQLWRKEEEGQYFMVNVPTSHEKAPPSSDIVRALSFRAYRLQEVSAKVTRLTLTFSMDLKGFLPTYITHRYVIPAGVGIPFQYQKYFQMIKPLSEFDVGGEDAAMLAHLLFDDVARLSVLGERKSVLQQYFIRAKSLRSIAVIYPWLLTLLWHVLQNMPQQSCFSCESPLRAFTVSDATLVGKSFSACLKESLTPQLAVESWLAKFPAMAELDTEGAWFRPFLTRIAKGVRLQGGGYGGGGESSSVGQLAKTSPIRVSETRFEEQLVAGGAFPQTKVVSQFTIGATTAGRLLSSEEDERALKWTTRHLSEMRRCFDKSPLFDKVRRSKFVKIVRRNTEVYTAEEQELIESGMGHFALFEGQRAKTLTMQPPTTKGKIVYSAGDAKAWGWSSAVVRSSAAEVLAYMWDSLSRAGVKEDDLEMSVDEAPNAHNQLFYLKKRTPAIIANREFLVRILWRAKTTTTTGGKVYEYVTESEENEIKRPHSSDVVRGTFSSASKLTASGGGGSEVKFEYVIRPDFGGALPGWVMNLYLNSTLSYVTEVQDYFQRLRRFSEYDERDGNAVGEAFMLRLHKSTNNTRIDGEEREAETRARRKGRKKHVEYTVASVVNTYLGLKDFAMENPWFPSLVEGMLSNWLSDSVIVKTKLDNLSNKEALAIGKSFSMTLYDRQVSDVAVDMFVNEYLPLIELNAGHRFFAPMAIVMGQRKLDRAVWGLVFKVGTGAVLGILDVATDIYAIANFMSQDNYGFASAVIAMVSVSTTLQVFIVYANGWKRGKQHVAKEVLIAMSGLKPAVDAFRVISGAKVGVDDLFDPHLELVLSKVGETVAESIPSALVQIYAIFSTGLSSPASIASIAISIATITLTTTTVCFDFDLDPVRRAHTPDFYGYIPNDSRRRLLVVTSMFCFTACHISVKMLGVALLAVLSPRITAAALGGEVVLFFLSKMLRDE